MGATYIGLWGAPNDLQAFEAEYVGHLAIAARLPGLRELRAGHALSGAYRAVLMSFDGPEDVTAALASAEGQALREDSTRLREKYAASVERAIVGELPRIGPDGTAADGA